MPLQTNPKSPSWGAPGPLNSRKEMVFPYLCSLEEQGCCGLAGLRTGGKGGLSPCCPRPCPCPCPSVSVGQPPYCQTRAAVGIQVLGQLVRIWEVLS